MTVRLSDDIVPSPFEIHTLTLDVDEVRDLIV